ncbi:hypothetical protein J4X78_13650, partial [Escherichia coli]
LMVIHGVTMFYMSSNSDELLILDNNHRAAYTLTGKCPLLAQSRLSDLITFGLCKLSVGK